MKKIKRHFKSAMAGTISLLILSQALCLPAYAVNNSTTEETIPTTEESYNPTEDSTFVLANSNVEISDDYLPETSYISEIENPELSSITDDPDYKLEVEPREYPEGLVLSETQGDPMVYLTQKWLNQEYSDVPGFGSVTVDGQTGWDTVYGLLRALQHELGITELADNFGPTTERLYAQNPLHRQDGVTNRKFAILQGALWCKGYSPGYYLHENPDGTVEFEEIFNEDVEDAIIELKEDAGFINPDGVVTTNVMKALMSMDSFKLLTSYGGDSKVRAMQQKINRKYEDYTGLNPCDGVYGRNTNKAIIYALQAEEGLPIDVANGNFGVTTKLCCPEIPYAKNSSAARRYPGTSAGSYYTNSQISAMTELLQFALYVNGFGNGVTDGVWGPNTQQAIRDFQSAYAINQTGKADKGTWLSLFISCGDTDRSALAADCATILTEAKAKSLYDNGYRYIGRYLTGTYNGGISKALTKEEANIIFDAGLRFFPIFQTSARSASYFTEAQGIEDANDAIEAASKLGVPANTIIYFAVDFDAMDYQVTANIIPYFAKVHSVMSGSKYRTGIYGTRNTCTRVSDMGYACSSFVGNMSTGFSGNLGFSMPENWAFDQFVTTSIGSGAGFLEIDKDGFSGRDHGVSKLDESAALIEAPSIDFGSTQSDKMQGPTINLLGFEVPLFELDINFESPLTDALEDLPQIEYDEENETYKITYGLAETEADPNLKNQDYAEIKEMINAFNHKTSTTTWNKYQKMRSKLKKRNIKFGFDFQGEFSGYLTLDKTGNIVEGGFLITAEATPSFRYPLIPVIYARLDIVGSVEAGFGVVIKDIGVLNPNGVIEFSVQPKLGLEANAIIANAFGGISGELGCRLEFPFSSLPEDFSSTFQGSVFLELSALSWGTEFTAEFPKYQLYPRPVSQNVLSIGRGDLKLIEPIYKNTTTYANNNPNAVAENMQVYCQPQIISLGDGRMLMAYIDDAPDRAPENRTILMYSVFDGSSWSSPEPVMDDGTGDFAPSMCSDGNGGAYILWQNTITEFDSDVTLEEMSSAVDLFCTHWDGNEFTEYVPITEGNTDYEMAHKIVTSGDSISVVWQQNSENDAFAMNGTNSIYRRQFVDGSWQNIELLASDLKVINSLDTTYIDGINVVAYSAKTTDDTTTINDLEIFYCLDSTIDPIAITEDNIADYSLYFSGKNLYWISENSVKCMNSLDSPVTIVETLDSTVSRIQAVESTDGRKAIVWSQADDSNTRFYVTYYNASTGNYGTPVPISDGEDVIRSWDACMQPDGQIELAYCAADNLQEPTDGKPYGQLDLIQKSGKEITDISVGNFTAYDGEVAPDNEITLITNVYNAGAKTIDQFDVNVIGEDGNILQATTIEQNLKAGESADIKTLFTLPSDITLSDYAVQVLPHGQTDELPSDNESTFTIGYSDLVIQKVERLQTDNGGQLKITVANRGFEPITSAMLNIRRNSIDGNILESFEIPTLNPQEEKVFTYSLTNELIKSSDNPVVNLLYLQAESSVDESDYNNNSQEVSIYSIKLTAGTGGTVQGTGVYAGGTNVTLSAIPEPGYIFDGWYENGQKLYSSPHDYEFEINADRILEARFIPNDLTITDVEIFGTLEIGNAITFTTVAEGGNDPYQWEFYIYKNDEICYSNSEATINFFEWTPETTGDYKLVVNVIDATGFKATHSTEFSVT